MNNEIEFFTLKIERELSTHKTSTINLEAEFKPHIFG